MAEDKLWRDEKNAIGCRLVSQCLFYLGEVRNDAEQNFYVPIELPNDDVGRANYTNCYLMDRFSL
jgi:hypothetical protein